MAEVVMRRDAPGHAFRAFHPKTHGCLHGEFKVNKNLPADLRMGLFQPGATFKTIAHFATSTPIHPPVDGIPMGKSVGIKMYGVKGKKIMPGHEDVEEMDMLFNNAPGFFCPDMVCFSALVTELARNPLPAIPTGKTGEEFGEYMEKGFGPILMAWGGKDPQFMEALQRLMAENEASAHSGHLGAYKFWAQAPFAYGEGKAAKFSLYPDNAAAYGIDKYPLEDGNFYLKNFRKSIVENKTPLKYKLYVQFQEDTCTEPIEDGSANWQTKEHHIGTFTFSDAVTDDEDRTCQNIGFQPYLVTEHFKPLGGLNRGRLDAYTRVIKMRQGYNLYRTMPKGALAETNAQKDVHDKTRPDTASGGSTSMHKEL
jgi:catalase